MKKLLFLGIFLIPLFTFGESNEEIQSSIKKVIVYPHGAQIEREASLSLQKGQKTLKFVHLSPHIDANSIRIDGDGSFVINNVVFKRDFMDLLSKNDEVKKLSEKIDELNAKIEEENVWIDILTEKLDFLKTNKSITGKEQTPDPETFNTFNTIYGKNIETLNLGLLKKKRLIKTYADEVRKLNDQINALNSKSDLPSGTILVTVDSKISSAPKIKLSYMVDKATWRPSYDIRFEGTEKPLSITHKANVSQNTGVDWEDVSIVLSTTKTDVSADIPELNTYFLNYFNNYFTQKDLQGALQGRVSGVCITSEDRDVGPDYIPGVQVRGIGSIKSSKPLYVVNGVPRSNISNIDPDEIENIEILKDASATAIYGSRGKDCVYLITTKSEDKSKSFAPMTVTTKSVISNEYIVDATQTILSDDNENTFQFKQASIKADFEYQAVPKLAKHVYLIGKVSDWSEAELMDGDANIYMENSFVGTSTINTQQMADTLEISFGIDNNIQVERESIKDFSSVKFLGSNKKVTKGYRLTVRNNKPYPVNITIRDQVPVSATKDIQAELIELSEGTLNTETGKVHWDLNLSPDTQKAFELKYSVRYPKDKTVPVE